MTPIDTSGSARTETLLAVENVSLTLSGNPVLRNVNVQIDNLVRQDGPVTGQIVAFLGPSGIGKSCLLRILAGLQRPTSGEVYLGAERSKVRPGSVGLVTQSCYVTPNRTVLGNLTLAAQQNPRHDVHPGQSARQMLERFGIADKASRYACELSGGQRQRVAIAEQLLCSSHFLLMDEPTAGLDPLAKQRVCELVTEVANADDLNTIIMVTHDIATAVALADTIWLMGRDYVDGRPTPGARIVQSYDCIERGIMWHPDVRRLPQYVALVQEIQDRFKEL